MPTVNDTETATELALAFQPTGFEEIPGSTILTRLNYYDGKFLRADDLRLEQNYLRRLAELGARAGGAGLVYGFDVFARLRRPAHDRRRPRLRRRRDACSICPASFGSASRRSSTRRQGRRRGVRAARGTSGFADLHEPDDATTPAPTSGRRGVLPDHDRARREACGDEDVFGKLCDDACATSTDRAYLVEGVVVRARPSARQRRSRRRRSCSSRRSTSARCSPRPTSRTRARGAEPDLGAGLLAGPWCLGAAAPSGWEVPIAVVGVLAPRLPRRVDRAARADGHAAAPLLGVDDGDAPVGRVPRAGPPVPVPASAALSGAGGARPASTRAPQRARSARRCGTSPSSASRSSRSHRGGAGRESAPPAPAERRSRETAGLNPERARRISRLRISSSG